jgi:hypothetical protein
MIVARIDDVTGEAIGFAREIVSLALPRAFAPGTPVRGSIAIDGVEIAIDARVLASKRRDDGRHDVRARLVSLRRDDRLRLETLGQGDDGPSRSTR